MVVLFGECLQCLIGFLDVPHSHVVFDVLTLSLSILLVLLSFRICDSAVDATVFLCFKCQRFISYGA